jgi:hypothetical protein
MAAIKTVFVSVLNVAAGKAPMQISSDLGGIPQKAIDGSTSSFFNVDTCTLTRAERVPWWYVNLLEPYMVQLVRLDFGEFSGTFTYGQSDFITARSRMRAPFTQLFKLFGCYYSVPSPRKLYKLNEDFSHVINYFLTKMVYILQLEI